MSATREIAHAPAPEPLREVRRLVDRRVDELLCQQQRRWTAVDPLLDEPVEQLRRFALVGGKRLRPGFCRLGHLAAGGDGTDPTLVDAGAALELLHVFALVHDDVMDGSALRRGRPTVHVHFERRHHDEGWAGEARRFGEGMAVLVGDLAVVLADALLAGAGPVARHVYDELRVELVMGQFLDVAIAANGSTDPGTSRSISLLKSAKYTVERPLHLGAALAGGLDELGPALSDFGLPLGEAFQLRDDLLGAFGDEEVLGKPVGDDFRDGKSTMLVSLAAAAARREQHLPDLEVLARIGRPDLDEADVDAVRHVLEATGARAAVEARVEELLDRSLAALDRAGFDPAVRSELADMARYCCRRDR